VANSAFSRKLKALREERGLTQQQLADQAGMHRFGVAKLERGEREPTWATVQALAKALGVSCEAFTDDEEPEAQPDPSAESSPPPAKGEGGGKARG
jgi:transcriptional regulator with XRE-family HTH domain